MALVLFPGEDGCAVWVAVVFAAFVGGEHGPGHRQGVELSAVVDEGAGEGFEDEAWGYVAVGDAGEGTGADVEGLAGGVNEVDVEADWSVAWSGGCGGDGGADSVEVRLGGVEEAAGVVTL